MTTMHVQGTDLHVEDRGRGPTILLIHGNGASTRLWGGAIDALAVDHRVIAHDRRGFGASSGDPVKDFRTHSDDACALLESLRAGPATVVGWSGGGIVALDVAVRRPDLVSSLVLEEPPLHVKRHMSVRMARAMVKAQLVRRLRGSSAGAEVFFRWASGYTTGGCAFDRFPAAWQTVMRDNGLATMRELDAGTGEYLTLDDLASIRCPVTCLVGGISDPVFGAATRRITEVVTHTRTVTIPEASHALHFDRPDEFVRAVAAAAAVA